MEETSPEPIEQILELLPRLKRFAFSLTGVEADAEDLAQSTVERALRTKTSPSGDELAFWLFRVCRNLWIDQTRRKNTESAWIKCASASSPEHSSSSDRLFAQKELHRMLSALSPDHQAVLYLVAIEGHSYKEAAMVLDCPVGTVMSRLARARAQITEFREDHDE